MRKIYAVGMYIKYYCLNFFYQTNTIFKFSEDFYPQINKFEKKRVLHSIIFADAILISAQRCVLPVSFPVHLLLP